MEEKNSSESYEKKIQKLKEEIEKGWNGPDSNEIILNLSASKQIYGNHKNYAMENKKLLKESKGFHLFSTLNAPTPLFTGIVNYCIGK